MKYSIHSFIILTLILSLLANCGKKLPPTSPDRWPPKLLNVNPVDAHHLQCYFSERLDTISPKKLENFKILNTENGETTSIIYSQREKKGDEILLTIPKLTKEKYSLIIFNIRDAAGNLMKKAEKSFIPSLKKDTIPPLLVSTKPMRFHTSAPQDSIIILRFSEPIDSTHISSNDFIATNMTIDPNFIWDRTLTKLTIGYKLSKEKLCKFFILPFVKDLSGNPLNNMKILTLTTADILPKTKLNITVTNFKKSLIKPYAFLFYSKDTLLADIVTIDTTAHFSFYFLPIDSFIVYTLAEDSVDTTGIMFGNKRIAFYPDTSGIMNASVNLYFTKKKNLLSQLFNIYNTITENIKGE
ncbi:MAG: hypothetical protein B5M53_05230 [Candidatus Cloacimonas sp. 4484_209]|nr:MAG: hypothetical protein B5M53_05230 [Candidatus Cloacimonas sp. 4484_209]